MRSARMLLSVAAVSAVIAIASPGAYAAGDDWSHDDSSYSKEKEHYKDSGYGKPYGGVHTGGGALTAAGDDWAVAKDPKYDPETYKQRDHAKPRGGMHTGGGALAAPDVTAGGLAVLAVAGTGLYAARRRKTAGSVA
ncbi:hypothetical protein [Streptomyces sp. HUCO-GS316]|uniref:hypothetical protein n=1 Tax=Streptomyces sp. HUCO-GS316 TaxID=2692198 RepID=UPI001F335F01|nr:hypothetical protein [Streptomyces sp. HUCO-GS316]